jgi:hypothetical protein
MWNVFEQPWTLLAAAVLVLLVTLILRSIFPKKRRWWQLALPMFIALIAFGLDFFIQTDAEKIKAVIYKGVKAVEQENPDAIEPIISDNYHDSYHNTKGGLLAHFKAILVEPLVKKNIARIVQMEISPPKATVVLTVRIIFDKQSFVYQNFKPLMLTKVKLDLQKEPDNRWLVSRAEILEIDLQPAKWRDITRANW